MGPRIYPSQQDTNTTAKGSLIMDVYPNISYVDVFVNNILVVREHSTVLGLYSININIGDVVRIEPTLSTSFVINRLDYTTDDVNGNNGIVQTNIISSSSLSSYTFTATTTNGGYNFEYVAKIGIPFPTPTPTPTPIPLPNYGDITVNFYYSFSGDTSGLNKRLRASVGGTGVGFWNTGFIGWYATGNTSADGSISGTTLFTNVNLNSPIIATIDLTTDFNYQQFYSTTGTYFNISVNGVPSYSVYSSVDDFVYSNNQIPNVRELLSTAYIELDDNDVLDIYVYSDLRLLPNVTPALPTGSLFYYDPGNITSYPGSGSVLYDLSGNNRHATINSGITWVSGSNAYFNFTGNTNERITGTTLNQTLTGWTMWGAGQRNEVGTDWSLIKSSDFVTGSNRIGQNSSTNKTIGTQGPFGVNFATQEGTGSIRTNEWMFIGAASSRLDPGSSTCGWVLSSVRSGSSYFNDIQDTYVDFNSYYTSPIFIGPDEINGRVGPTLMYGRLLTGQELNAINLYFKSRYI